MEFENLTVRELMAALEDGSVTQESLAKIPGVLGQGARNSLHLQEAHLLWPDPHKFRRVLATGLRDPRSGRPPELGKTAQVIGCDPKTLMKHCWRHLGVRKWRELLNRLVTQGMAAISTDPSAPDGTQGESRRTLI